MSDSNSATVDVKQAKPARPKVDPTNKPKRQPPYGVIILNDDHHTYEYVIEVIQRVFGYDLARAFKLTREVDKTGRALVWSGPMETAEFKRDRVTGFGPDVYARKPVTFPLGCVIEPLPQ